MFLKGQILHPRAQRKSIPGAEIKNGAAATSPGQLFSKKPAKRHKTLVRNYENSTELLIFVELLTYKSLKLLWSSNFSPFIYKPTQKTDDKQVPKYDFHW